MHFMNHICWNEILFFFIIIGDYSVISQSGNKKVSGTLPSELGQLKSWKYVVFRK